MRPIFIAILLCIGSVLYAQQNTYPYQAYFEEAYDSFPNIPRGMLEAIAYTNTRMQHLTPQPHEESCSGMPLYYGVMGLIEDGKGYFYSNLPMVAKLSGYSVEDIKASPRINILAYAKAYSWRAKPKLYPYHYKRRSEVERKWIDPIHKFTEIPNLLNSMFTPGMTKSIVDNNRYPLKLYRYTILSFLKDRRNQIKYNFPEPQFDLEDFFDEDFLQLMEAPFVNVNQSGARQSADYGPAIWNPTTCNYSSRSGAVSAVTVHVTQGSYAGSISWFKNCSANVSAHYVIRSSDGQITQVVAESDKAWHVGSENDYTIGIEHEGFVSNPSWFTPAMYASSANLVKDICADYSINPLSTYKGTSQTVLNACYQVKGHVHFPNQTHTDPGVNWDWPYYYNLINDDIAETTLTACTGTFTDNGGSGANYNNFEKYLTKIAPAGASSVTMNFSSFSTEVDYDYLYIYDGSDINTAPLLGSYSGTVSPGTVTANSGVMSLLFDSDCIINSDGWEATWSCVNCGGGLAVNVDSVKDESCTNAGDGSIYITASGGNTPYAYQWSTGATGSDLNGLSSGNYSVTVADNQGCNVVASATVGAVQGLVHTIVVENVSCHGENDGIAAVSVQGGNLPYTYNWDDGKQGFLRTDLTAGWHTLTVTDAQGCNFVDSVQIQQPTELQLDSLIVNSANNTYTVDASQVSGGIMPYTYFWSTGVMMNSITNVAPGFYYLEVTDANGCTVDTAFTLAPLVSGIYAIQAGIVSFNLFPNPVKEQAMLHIRLDNPIDFQLAVYDMAGRVIVQHNYSDTGDKLVKINTSALSPGVYHVVVKTDRGIAGKRLMVY